MNDTETRLRDYLQTAAATVADTDQGPGLETAGTAHRRRWPVVLAAAAIAAILVLTASFLTRVLPDRSGPAEGPIPPLTDAAPRVPYTVRNGSSSTLYDGTQQVRIPAVDGTFLFWRAGGGWLGSQTPERGQFQAGILRPDGTFRPLGPVRSELPTPSPDRKQVALMHYLPNGQGEIVVVDLKSGREKAHTPAFQGWPALLGWNRTGIWFSTGDPSHPQLITWKPGSGQPREITVPHFDGGLSAPAASGSISLSTRNGDARCLQTGTLRDGRFEVLREYCDRGA